MCYGSGCSRENHMGDCSCFLTREQEKILEESNYTECVLFGNEHCIVDFYLTKDEHSKFHSTMLNNNNNNNNSDKAEELESIDYEKLAYERWEKDEERLELIKKLGLEVS